MFLTYAIVSLSVFTGPVIISDRSYADVVKADVPEIAALKYLFDTKRGSREENARIVAFAWRLLDDAEGEDRQRLLQLIYFLGQMLPDRQMLADMLVPQIAGDRHQDAVRCLAYTRMFDWYYSSRDSRTLPLFLLAEKELRLALRELPPEERALALDRLVEYGIKVDRAISFVLLAVAVEHEVEHELPVFAWLPEEEALFLLEHHRHHRGRFIEFAPGMLRQAVDILRQSESKAARRYVAEWEQEQQREERRRQMLRPRQRPADAT